MPKKQVKKSDLVLESTIENIIIILENYQKQIKNNKEEIKQTQILMERLITLVETQTEQLSEVKNELRENAMEYELVREIIKARQENKLTQHKLAEIINTKQSNISRLESGQYNPTISFLHKIANAMGKRLEIRLVN